MQQGGGEDEKEGVADQMEPLVGLLQQQLAERLQRVMIKNEERMEMRILENTERVERVVR